MKGKVIIIVALLQFTMTTHMARAQYSDYYYHRVGDTIEWKSEIGYYSWWEFESWFQQNRVMGINTWLPMSNYHPDSAIMLQRFYTPAPLKIIGIASSSIRGLNTIHAYPIQQHLVDTDEFKQYLYIYDAMPDSFPLVASVEWNPFDPYRFVHLGGHYPTYWYDSCCLHAPAFYYCRLYEYYFDSAIYVTDSFYVGGSDFSAYDEQNTNRLATQYWAATPASYTKSCYSEDPQTALTPTACHIPGVKIKIKHGERGSVFVNDPPFYQADWEYGTSPLGQSVMIYPIIEVDTTVPPEWACDPIANVQVTTAGTSATVTWDGFPNYSRVLLRYGKRTQPQSQWREEDVTGNTLYTLTDLDPVSFYSVSLKAECDTSKKETPWSEPVTFYVGTDTSGGGTEGIKGGETLLSRLTFLQPNPAQDEVTVTSSFNLTAIDIWTADGVMVYHGERSGHDTSVDVSWLRAGTYIVTIHTHNGTTHKRLLIAR